MTESSRTEPGAAKRPRLPLLELLLVFGLPLAVLIAGAYTIAAAVEQGFTPIADTPVAPKGH
jgi:hypothetical protein